MVGSRDIFRKSKRGPHKMEKTTYSRNTTLITEERSEEGKLIAGSRSFHIQQGE